MKVIPVASNRNVFYRQYVEFLAPFKELRDREKDVLAELLYLDNQMNDLPEDVKAKLLLDYDNRIYIREKLKISERNFNFILHGLREKGIINNNRIAELYKVDPANSNEDGTFNLIFRFYENK
jgi:hypothetical protein